MKLKWHWNEIEMKWNEMKMKIEMKLKWNEIEMKLKWNEIENENEIEMKWNEIKMKWNGMKWNEMKWMNECLFEIKKIRKITKKNMVDDQPGGGGQKRTDYRKYFGVWSVSSQNLPRIQVVLFLNALATCAHACKVKSIASTFVNISTVWCGPYLTNLRCNAKATNAQIALCHGRSTQYRASSLLARFAPGQLTGSNGCHRVNGAYGLHTFVFGNHTGHKTRVFSRFSRAFFDRGLLDWKNFPTRKDINVCHAYTTCWLEGPTSKPVSP